MSDLTQQSIDEVINEKPEPMVQLAALGILCEVMYCESGSGVYLRMKASTHEALNHVQRIHETAKETCHHLWKVKPNYDKSIVICADGNVLLLTTCLKSTKSH